MEPDVLVDASMAGLALGELICLPLVKDIKDWTKASQAIRDIGSAPLASTAATRYGATTQIRTAGSADIFLPPT